MTNINKNYDERDELESLEIETDDYNEDITIVICRDCKGLFEASGTYWTDSRTADFRVCEACYNKNWARV